MSTSSPPVLVDGQGRQITLGAELGHGGEGKVYEISGRSSRSVVVKLWHPGVVRDQTALAAVALRLQNGWPDGTMHARLAPMRGFVYDGEGALAGVTLERLPDRVVALSDLLTAEDRRKAKLAATPHWQLRVAARMADVAARAHDVGLVVGDLTPRNFVVARERARVTAFDTDAWQTDDRPLAPRRITPDALAPEQVRSPVAPVPSIEADLWALAVAVAQILLDGRHPCDGVRPDGSMDVPLLDDNVRDGYSHFSPVALRPVQGAPRLAYFPPRVRELVEQAFGAGHMDAGRRPDARAWVRALRADDAELIACANGPARATRNHRVHPEADCVGCAMIGAGLADPYAR